MRDNKNRDFIIVCFMLLLSLLYIVSKDFSFNYKKISSAKSFLSGAFENQFGAIVSATNVVGTTGTSISTTSKIISTSTASTTKVSTSTSGVGTTSVRRLPPESPTDYTENKNGTVIDNYTGLVWKKCSQGLTGNDCKIGSPSLRVWAKAKMDCDDLVFAGSSDWRLPTLKELQSIVNSQSYEPAINKTFFVNTLNDPYWTETSPARYLASRFTVIFTDGSVYYKDSNNYAATRCVRGGN